MMKLLLHHSIKDLCLKDDEIVLSRKWCLTGLEKGLAAVKKAYHAMHHC